MSSTSGRRAACAALAIAAGLAATEAIEACGAFTGDETGAADGDGGVGTNEDGAGDALDGAASGDAAGNRGNADAGGATDAIADASAVFDGRCDPTGPFTTVTPLGDGVNTPEDETVPSLVASEDVVYFTRLGTRNLWESHRAPSGQFGVATAVATSPGSTPYDMQLAAGDAVGFVTYVNGAANDIGFVAFDGGALGPIQPLASFDTAAQEYFPSLVAATHELWFARTIGSPATVLFSAPAFADGGFGLETEHIGLEVESIVNVPVLSKDGLTIYFSATQSTTDGYDIYVAHRTSASDEFSPPTALALSSTDGADFPGWVSADDCRLYFSSRRGGGAGGLDIYVAGRGP